MYRYQMIRHKPEGLVSVLRLAAVCLVVILVLGSPASSFAQTPTPKPKAPAERISFPPEIMKDYTIVSAESMVFAGATGNYLVVGYAPKVFSLDPQTTVKSFLAIYKQGPTGFDEVYRYLPVPAASTDYPTPLSFENMWAATTFGQSGPETTLLLTAWGETGADYFGTHPIALAYDKGAFKAVPLYQGKLAENPKIKGFQWTAADFQVTNASDKKNAVDTILTQGITVQAGTAVLSFYADNECHACEHKIVTIEIPLTK
jgi:hypothetical protein